MTFVPPLPRARLRPPPERPTAVARSRLDERLEAAVRLPVALVAAPAGYGKSTAVAHWARTRTPPPAWWSLEPSDAPPERFAPLLAAAAAHGWSLDVGLPSGAAPADHVAALLAALERAPEADRVLVLDDVHELGAAPEAFELLRSLLDHLPDGTSVLLVSRVDPDLPLARWHLEGRFDRVGTDDLRFREGEAAGLLAALGVALRPSMIRTLVQRTEGWGAGLHLAALGLRGRAPDALADFVERFTGTDPYVLEYLAEEVLQRLPPALQDFLLRVSVADVLDVPTAVALGGRADAAELLAAAERAHLFLHPVDADGRQVRFHASFRELLRRRLVDADPKLAADLRARVAGRAAADAEPLTDREREVLRWLATGATNDAIAARLELSPNTVKTHLKRVFEKLDVGTRTAAVARARELELI
jgi:LuxR family maltose regulon positive regulatory protein